MAENITSNTTNGNLNLNLNIEIQNGNKGYFPEVVGSVTLTTERKGSPGKLVFSVIWDDVLQVEEGNLVKMSVHGTVMFYGFIFTLNHTKSKIVQITAYDQIRYLLNKDTYVFKNATAAAIVNMIAADYGIRTGEIEETAYTIPGRVMDNKTLLDMIQDCLDITLTNTKSLYCLYDDAGKLTLQQVRRMAVGLLIDAEAAENFSYSSSIDSGTYNLIKLVYEEKKDGTGTGQRQIFVERSGETEKKWGTLQYFENISDTTNVMYINECRPLAKKCFTEKYGANQCMLAVRENLMKQFGVSVDETVLERVIRHGTADISQRYLTTIRDTATEYAEGIFRRLREHEYDPELMRLYVVGGGSCILKNFGSYDKDRVIINDDICATAKGYELLAEQKQSRKGGIV